MVPPVLDLTPLQAQNPHPMKPNMSARAPQSGFTLIELLIAVVIVGILLGVALPSFMESIRKGRRSEAFTAMAAVQQAQERYRSNRPNYSPDLATLTAISANLVTPTAPSGYYALSTSTATGTESTAYEVIADSTSSGANSSQSNDSACARLGVRTAGGRIQYASGTTFTYADTNPCWSR